ncbi:MAG: alpha/beta hydrolase [Betaproteobacteria bacterium]|nr:alpha/beta hydrolase [Betaproteobacteria bacterium]
MGNGTFRERRLDILSPHGFSAMHYYEWGDPANRDVVICVHGLTRNGRDFDALAGELCGRFRVLCPDIPGRGKSDWLRDPNDYVFATYVGALTALIARAEPESLSWVGTSMGGLLGIALAGQPGTPIRRLVVNDVGPVIEQSALQRIGAYVGANPVFATFADLEAHIRFVSAPFGALTDAQWRQLSETTARQLPDGRWALGYDPGIAVPFRAAQDQSALLWALWDAISCPVLLLRGARSDLLARATAREMSARGPGAALLEFPDVGHAPMLLDANQIAPVAAFLRA